MLDPWAVNNSKWKKRLAAWAFEDRNLRGAACIRALCESEALSIRGYGLKNPICIIPNGVALPDVSRNLRDDDCVSEGDGRKTLLYLGRLHPKKNLGPLLYAWAQLQRDNAAAQNWTLAIVGWDENGFEEQLRALWADVGAGLRNCGVTSVQGGGSIQKRGLSYSSPPSMGGNQLSCVHFLGARFGEGKAACYSDCDGFVLPSLSEGLPMVVLEAWAYGKPVVMTTACNLPEGFSARAAVPIGTSAAGIAAGLITLIEMSDSDRSAMGRRGRELVRSKFAWPRIGEEMRRVCEWVVGGGLQPVSVRV
jgi:poly(glycerol-phosphate) alpha-glucosyltransferase